MQRFRQGTLLFTKSFLSRGTLESWSWKQPRECLGENLMDSEKKDVTHYGCDQERANGIRDRGISLLDISPPGICTVTKILFIVSLAILLLHPHPPWLKDQSLRLMRCFCPHILLFSQQIISQWLNSPLSSSLVYVGCTPRKDKAAVELGLSIWCCWSGQFLMWSIVKDGGIERLQSRRSSIDH